MNRTKNAVKGVFSGIICKFITIVSPFILRIIIIRTIGVEYIGVSSVFQSVFTMLSLTELGFSSAIAYKCYKLFAENNVNKIKEYLNFYKNIYRVVGTVILIAGLILIPFLKNIVRDDLPKDLNLYIIYLMYLFQTVISYFLYAYKSVVLIIFQRQDVENNIAIICNCFMYIARIGLLIAFRNYYLYLVTLPISTVLMNLIREWYVRKYFRDYMPKGHLSLEEKKELFQKTFLLMGRKIEAAIVSGADNVVISVFLGVVMVAVYNNYCTILTALGSLIYSVYAALQPGIGNSMATESIQKNYKDFKHISFFLIWLTGWMGISAVCLFDDFISYAYGASYRLELVTVILLVAQFYIHKSLSIIMTYRDVVGKWEGDVFIPYISGILNLVINIILVHYIGINGVIISTVLTAIAFSIPFSLRVIMKFVFHKPMLEYIRFYAINTLFIIIAGIITYYFCGFIKIELMLVQMFLKGLICLFLPNLILIAINHKKEEYLYFRRKIIGFIRVTGGKGFEKH